MKEAGASNIIYFRRSEEEQLYISTLNEKERYFRQDTAEISHSACYSQV
jgi:hypothetical protein